ncbi:MAG: S1C family serine protease [Betaproteobacteria bacterium]|nr:S1C family serine protease [Betaproteobacteria bacterium]
MPSLITAAWAAWGAANLPVADKFAADDLAGAIVKLGIRVPPTARTADMLGTEREGTGVLIDDAGHILTIGYLLLEAQSILIVAADGRVLPATVAGFDHATGFGLVRAAQSLDHPPLALGDSSALREMSTVAVAAHAGAGGWSNACIVKRRSFTGWWEYALDDAIFTAPARDNHSGAALIDDEGQLIGIGSLWVGDAIDAGAAFPGNMFVPTDLLKPILKDLTTQGRRSGAARPWLGIYSEEMRQHLVVTQVLRDSPAERGGLKRGDVILALGGQAIGNQAEFYHALWASGGAGNQITLQIWRAKTVHEISVHSIDRMEYLRAGPASAH